MKLHYERITKKRSLRIEPTSKFYTFDIETKDGLKGCEYFCSAIASSSKRSIIFHDMDELSSYLLSREKNMKIYVHNLDFDVRFLSQICYNEKKLNFQRFGSSKTIAFIINHKISEKKTIQLKFIDSLQFLFKSQAVCEKIFKVDVSLTKIDCHDLFEKNFIEWDESEKERMIHHNLNDVKALHDILKKLRKIVFNIFKINFNNYISISSLALDCWRTTIDKSIINPFLLFYMNDESNEKNFIFHEEKYNFVRKSYFGGRNEFIRNPKTTEFEFFYNDYHSFFPSQMMKPFPTGTIHHVLFTNDNGKNVSIFHTTCENFFGIYEVRVKSPKNSKNIMFLHSKQNRLIFPQGSWEGVYTSIEIEKALELGYEINFIAGRFFTEKQQIFKKYIDLLYSLKEKSEENNASLYLFSKILMNSLYGKFAQKREIENTVYDIFENFDDSFAFMQEIDENAKMSVKNDKFIVSHKEKTIVQKAFQIPHFSSFTTSYARIQLYEDIQIAEEQNILYMDTDSLLTNTEGHENLKSAGRIKKGLGFMGVEWKSSNFYCFTEKSYLYKNNEGEYVLKCKGLSRKYINDELEKIRKTLSTCTFDEITNIVRKDLIGGFSGFKKFNNLRSSLIRTGNSLSYNEVKKKFTLLRNKRNFESDTCSHPRKIKN